MAVKGNRFKGLRLFFPFFNRPTLFRTPMNLEWFVYFKPQPLMTEDLKGQEYFNNHTLLFPCMSSIKCRHFSPACKFATPGGGWAYGVTKFQLLVFHIIQNLKFCGRWWGREGRQISMRWQRKLSPPPPPAKFPMDFGMICLLLLFILNYIWWL